MKEPDLQYLSSFSQKEKKISSMNGWFDSFSLTIFDILLNLQSNNEIFGNILEIGVWEGKSASTFVDMLQDREKIFLIDPILKKKKDIIITNFNKIIDISDEDFLFFEMTSEDFKTKILTKDIIHSFRFIHIDGNHTAEGIYKDLELADLLLLDNGIVAIDDFFNMAYPQITEALLYYIFSNPYKFRIFLCGFNKVYLCRPGIYSKYYTYVISYFQKEFRNRNKQVSINKTSSLGDSFIISLTDFHLGDCNEKGIRGPDWQKNNIEIIADINTGEEVHKYESN